MIQTQNLPQPKTVTIEDILNTTPEELSLLSNDKLKELLAPLFPAARKAILPPDKPKKMGVQDRLMRDILEQNKDAIAAFKKERK